MKKNIVIGCDDAALALKDIFKKCLADEGYTVEDIGVYTGEEGTYYPNVAAKLCQTIIDSGYEKEGILLCGTGIGMALTANKFPGIYAAVCHDAFSTERARLSNNANVLCMGARVVGTELAKKLLKEWLKNEYKPGTSSEPKVLAIQAIEKGVYAE